MAGSKKNRRIHYIIQKKIKMEKRYFSVFLGNCNILKKKPHLIKN